MFEKLRQLREGGQVQRCHTVPHVGSYDLAQHSWHAAVLLMELHPEASKELLEYVLLHDMEERWLGDIPAFTKWAFPKVQAAFSEAEAEVQTLVGLKGGKELTAEEQLWAKTVDCLELWMWCLDQLNIGNQNVRNIIANLEDWVNKNIDVVPIAAIQVFDKFRWERSNDFITEF